MTYIYIFEDGQVTYSKTAPTVTDYEMIGDGLLQVVSVGGDTVNGVSEDRSVYPLEEAALETFEGKTFHCIPL